MSLCQTGSKRMCAISIQLSDGSSLLVVNVYFPTDDGSTTSKDALIFVLGELEALIGTQQCDHLLVAGDFNIDFSRNSVCCRTVLNFFNQHALIPVDLHFGDNVGWTFETHTGYRGISIINNGGVLLSPNCTIRENCSKLQLTYSTNWSMV